MSDRKAVRMTARDWVFGVLTVLFLVWIVQHMIRDGVQWTRSWFDRVNYERHTAEIAPVIEQVAGCGPCEVDSISISEHRLRFVVRHEDGRHVEYAMRDKYLADVNAFRHLDDRNGRELERAFDPRTIDPQILRSLVEEARASEPDEWRWTATTLRVDRLFSGEDPVCFTGGTVKRAVDGVSPCKGSLQPR